MNMIEKLRKQLADIQTRAKAIIEAEERSDAANANLEELLAEGKQIEARIAELVKLDELTSAGDQLDALASGATHRRAEQSHRTTETSLGEQFVRSDVFQTYPARGTSSRFEMQERALPMGIGTVAAGLPNDPQITLDNAADQTPLLGLIPTVQVSQNALEIVTWAKTAGGAAVVAEGAGKPSAEWAPTVTPVSLDTVAVYTQLTRQLVEDAPAVRSMIDGELRREIVRKLEADSAAALVAATLPTATDPSLLKAIRKGIGTVQAAGWNPTVVLLNPADYATLDIDVLGRTFLGPVVGQRFWGVIPVASSAQPAGVATVGDFAAGLVRYARDQVSLYITDSHADTFIKNVFTLLAEIRSKTVVLRPSALAECSVA